MIAAYLRIAGALVATVVLCLLFTVVGMSRATDAYYLTTHGVVVQINGSDCPVGGVVYVVRQEVWRGPDRVVLMTPDLNQAMAALRYFQNPGPTL